MDAKKMLDVGVKAGKQQFVTAGALIIGAAIIAVVLYVTGKN